MESFPPYECDMASRLIRCSNLSVDIETNDIRTHEDKNCLFR